MIRYTWPCVSGTLEKFTRPVYAFTVAYTRRVTFYKVPEKHGHVKCKSGQVVYTDRP